MRRSSLTVLCFVFSASLAFLGACTKDHPTIPYGPLTATGTLLPTDVSLVRRGTHLLSVNGKSEFYVESRSQNLQEFEGQTVTVEGILEPNTGKNDLPVVLLTSVKRAYGDEGLHIWNIPALNVRIIAPDNWQGKIEKGVATFSLPGESSSLLTVQHLSGSTLPQGSSFYIKNRRATRTEDSLSTVQEIFVLEKDSIISFVFDPSTQESLETADEGKIAEAQFERLIADIVFLSDEKFTQQVTGSGSGTPCGGPAGLLCPGGYYCDINDAAMQIGKCRKR